LYDSFHSRADLIQEIIFKSYAWFSLALVSPCWNHLCFDLLDVRSIHSIPYFFMPKITWNQKINKLQPITTWFWIIDMNFLTPTWNKSIFSRLWSIIYFLQFMLHKSLQRIINSFLTTKIKIFIQNTETNIQLISKTIW
jgi:hypothetical protein